MTSGPSEDLKNTFKELSNKIYRAATVGKCIACGTCVRFCPLNIRVIKLEKKAITIKTELTCGGCSVCYKRCPQGAIKLIQVKRE